MSAFKQKIRRFGTGKATLRSGMFSLKLDLRSALVFAALSLVTFAGVVANVGHGEYPIPPLEVIRTIFGLETSDSSYSFIVNTLRLPRALVAVLAGAALAISGAILQGIVRNPLASPEIVGINAGASLAAVTLIVALPSVSVAYLPPAAFGGALAVALLVYALAWRGQSSPIRLVLIGIAIGGAGVAGGTGGFAGAFTTLLITSGDIQQVSQALIWLTGSVYGRGWSELWAFMPWFLIFAPLALILSRHLNALNLGDEIAQGVGARLEAMRGLLLLTSVGLAGSAVATAGTIGFVGLMAPHIARQMVGPAHGGLIPVAAMTGGAIVVLSDFVGRVVLAPTEIPCGIITAILGAPYFMYLLYKNRNK